MSEIIITRAKDYLLKKEKAEKQLKQQNKDETLFALRSLNMLWRKYKLERVYLYGSFVDMSFYKNSDIDLAIEPEIGFEDQLKLYTEVNRYMKREVELRLLKELPFAEKIKREGIVIYESES